MKIEEGQEYIVTKEFTINNQTYATGRKFTGHYTCGEYGLKPKGSKWNFISNEDLNLEDYFEVFNEDVVAEAEVPVKEKQLA